MIPTYRRNKDGSYSVFCLKRYYGKIFRSYEPSLKRPNIWRFVGSERYHAMMNYTDWPNESWWDYRLCGVKQSLQDRFNEYWSPE